MSVKRRTDSDEQDKEQPTSELEALIEEKMTLAAKLGLMNVVIPDDEIYKHTDEYKRIQEIDKRLWELV